MYSTARRTSRGEMLRSSRASRREKFFGWRNSNSQMIASSSEAAITTSLKIDRPSRKLPIM